jgi:hypothetical protein
VDSVATVERGPLARRSTKVLSSAVVCVVLTAGPALPLEASRTSLETRRLDLAKQWRASGSGRVTARQKARAAILAHLDTAAFPAWAGTKWGFYGTTTTPREGEIACGYFVTTVLEQTGFKLARVELAQQASAWLVKSVARGSEVTWLRYQTPQQVVDQVREKYGDGLYVVGFDLHVGFLRLDGARAAFCHASYLDPGVVTCEDPLTSAAFLSDVHVVGNVLNDNVIDDWILGRDIPSVLPKKPRRS